MIEELEIKQGDKIYRDYNGELRYVATGGKPAELTGWLSYGGREWYLNGKPSTAQEVFDQLTDEEKEKAIWELDEWK